ncbi:MAG: hypothetical protein RHS_2539 [Robinsoniella sp. RHS]|nr:MAG: hypothetical protein RHS_2539 [Robinsoniella sp. RHS]
MEELHGLCRLAAELAFSILPKVFFSGQLTESVKKMFTYNNCLI